MSTVSAEFSGVVVYWNCAGTNWYKLRDVLRDINREDYIPPRMSMTEAIKAALVSLYSAPGMLVRPLPPNVGGFAVVEERPSTDGRKMNYSERLRVEIAANYPIILGVDGAEMERIRSEIMAQRETVSASAVGKMLTGIVHSLSGIPLRASGGFYWISPNRASAWRILASAIEGAAPGNVVYTMTINMDDGGKRAALDAIKADIESTIRQSQIAIANAGNARTYKTQAAVLDLYYQRLTEYEGIFGPVFTAVKEQMDKVVVELCMASGAAFADLVGDMNVS